MLAGRQCLRGRVIAGWLPFSVHPDPVRAKGAWCQRLTIGAGWPFLFPLRLRPPPSCTPPAVGDSARTTPGSGSRASASPWGPGRGTGCVDRPTQHRAVVVTVKQRRRFAWSDATVDQAGPRPTRLVHTQLATAVSGGPRCHRPRRSGTCEAEPEWPVRASAYEEHPPPGPGASAVEAEREHQGLTSPGPDRMMAARHPAAHSSQPNLQETCGSSVPPSINARPRPSGWESVPGCCGGSEPGRRPGCTAARRAPRRVPRGGPPAPDRPPAAFDGSV